MQAAFCLFNMWITTSPLWPSSSYVSRHDTVRWAWQCTAHSWAHYVQSQVKM